MSSQTLEQTRRKPVTRFDPPRVLAENGARTLRFERRATVFTQGSPATTVFYVEHGGVKLSVLSSAGKEAVVGLLGPGDFFGEGCLTGQPLRMGLATAVTTTTVWQVPKETMTRLLHTNSDFSDGFIRHILERNIRIEEDLIDQLFNSSEKRLARTLLLLGRYGNEGSTPVTLPNLSQETLAEMIGTTRSRVNFFMNKFRRLGFIEYSAAGMTVRSSRLSVVLHEPTAVHAAPSDSCRSRSLAACLDRSRRLERSAAR
jgi:CRP/FNR family cyclic AMP-dependent transcriptional regulator